MLRTFYLYGYIVLMLALGINNANATTHYPCDDCDNATIGGSIVGNESGCNGGSFNPSLISSETLPEGGTGELEYIWIYSTNDLNAAFIIWTPIAGSNSPSFDPGTITQTTHYRRCARRAGCTDYVAESNIITKVLNCCSIEATATLSDVTCPGANDGSISINPTTGEGAINFVWTGTNATTNTVTGIGAGTYSVTLSDEAGCTLIIDNIIISQPSPIEVAASISDVSCNADNNGSIALTVSGAQAPYTYSINGDADEDGLFSNLNAGTYNIAVSDANGCAAEALSFTISEPSAIQCNATVSSPITSNGANDGSLAASAQGGSGSYTYEWNTGQTSQIINNQAAGTYSVTISDLYGCTCATSVILTQPSVQGVNIGNYVFNDSNQNGLQDANEDGINGVKVTLMGLGADNTAYTNDDIMVAMQFTYYTNGHSGNYLFNNITPGQYYLNFFIDNSPYYITDANAGDDALDSDVNGDGVTAIYDITSDNLSIDAGFYKDCDNLTSGGSIGYDETVCGAGTAASLIESLSNPVGGSGTLQYVWLSTTLNTGFGGYGDTNWSEILNATGASLEPGSVGQTTYFVRCSRREGCIDYIGETNIVTKTVQPFPNASILSAPLEVCVGEAATFEAAIAGAGATYSWDFGSNATPDNATTRKVTDVVFEIGGIQTVSLSVTQSNCTLTVTTLVNVDACSSSLVSAYPNPVNNSLVVTPQQLQSGARISLRNLLGQPLDTRQSNGQSAEIFEMGDQQNGIYILHVLNTDGQQQVIKVMKQ